MDAAAPAPDLPASVPRRVGRYRVLGELGRGGMGVVYRAEDDRLGREVALKVLPEALARDPEAKAQLLAEARAAATLDHPNVCTVYEVGETPDGRPFLALACYDGETLAERLARGPVEPDEAVRIARGVAAGVAAAHAKGIVHRDLKPANVFLCDDGTPKVLDFGVARVDGDGADVGETAGTLAYAAPELDAGIADARADVWALGLVLYEMLTGANPFMAPYAAAVRYNVLHEDPPPPSARADVSEALDAVVARCLAKDPVARYPDAAALADALAEAVAPAPRPAVVARLRPLYAGLAVGLAALTGVGVWAVQPGGPFAREAVHLAVLAFEPTSDDPDDRAFAEGLAETIASGVTEAAPPDAKLWVVPMSEVRGLAVTTARAAGTALGANRVLTGRLVREGTGLVLTLDLASTGDRPRTLDSRTLSVGAGGTVRGPALQAAIEMLGLGGVAAAQVPRVAHGTGDPDAQRFFLAGVGYFERDRDQADLGRAIDLFEQAVAEDARFAAGYAWLGRAYLERYKETKDSVWIGRTRATADRARALDDGPDVHVTLSGLAMATGDTPLAMHHAREALARDSTSLGALRALADAQEAGADVAGAEATWRRLLRRHPGAWSGPYDLGWFYLRQVRAVEAVDAFRRVVALAPDNYKGHVSLGAALYSVGDLDGARAAYERGLELRPDDRSARANLATLLLSTGDAAGAARHYRRALALDSTSHLTWRNLAAAYSMTGERRRWRAALRGALRWAEARLAVNPNDPDVLVAAATYRQQLGAEPAALADARRAQALAPADPTVLYDAARVFGLAGRVDEALAALASARAAGHPLDPDAIAADVALADLAAHPRFPGPR